MREKMKLNHIAVEVTDIYRMELFYRKVFGFRTSYRYVSANTPGLKTVMLEKDGVSVELLMYEGNPVVKNKNHVSFYTDDVDLEFSRIKSNFKDEITGLKEPRITGDGFREFGFSDPEGNLIEIGKRVKRFDDYGIKAVIFDLDGTLIDSEENYYLSDRRLFGEFGVDLTQEMKHKFVGMSNTNVMDELKRRFNIDEPVEMLIEKKNGYYLEIARKNTRIFPEMKIFVEMLRGGGFPMAIASGSSSCILDELVPMLHLDDYCSVIISADHVKNGKPQPDIFLESAKRLGIRPENCLVVEDSKYGVEAAKRAFMYCIAIPYIADDLDGNFLMADLLYDGGMKDFRAKKALQWIYKINSRGCK
jgi:HAD superfamily hydrolase (TIGR01509 family)